MISQSKLYRNLFLTNRFNYQYYTGNRPQFTKEIKHNHKVF